MQNKLVTITIPTYNSGPFLERCLDSIKNQTYKNIEISIVDGNSKDNTFEIAKRYGISAINYPGALLGARYEGVKRANGEYVLLLDSDQVLESDCLERAVNMMDNIDMLVLEEDVYKCDSFIEKLFHYDRKLVHAVKDFDPMTGVMLPRLYRKSLLISVFLNIPKEIIENIGGQDHAIIYYEAWGISKKVEMLDNAVKHIEPNSFKSLWKKFYRWGYTSVEKRIFKYDVFLNKKTRLRSGLFKKGFLKESIASIVLLVLKGVPYKIGVILRKLKK